MKTLHLIYTLGLVGLLAIPSTAEPVTETVRQFRERTAWWREAKFGLFIHWGIYSVPADATDRAGHHRIAEWYQANKQMPLAEYRQFAARFNPQRFDAAQWVRLARNAGMRYLVITSKHHDGFCLWDSPSTTYDVMDAAPFDRDPLKELAAECQRQGVRLCFYHSIMDWQHADYLPRREWEVQTRPAAGADLNRYLDYMKGQLRELLTGYGPIGILWWDGGWELDGRQYWTPQIEQRMRPREINAFVRSLQPRILINDRNNLPEDYSTPEQSVPATAFPEGRLWETCLTMNETWGYATNDHQWKSGTALIRKLCDIAHKGGNLLLNVGPTADGEFPPESVERLEQIGGWMDLNGRAIYGTTASPFRLAPFDGRCTVKGRSLFLHVFKWPEGPLRFRGLQTPVRLGRALRDGQVLRVNATPGKKRGESPEISVERPREVDAHVTVVELVLAGPPRIADPSPAIKAEADGTIRLKAVDAEISGTTGVIRLRYDKDADALTDWIKVRDYPKWTVDLPRTGRYGVEIDYGSSEADAGSRYRLGQQGDAMLEGVVESTGSPAQIRTDRLGELWLTEGRRLLVVRPQVMTRSNVMTFKEVRLLRPW